MDRLSLDYAAVTAAVARPMTPELVGAMLVIALGDRYEDEQGESSLYEFAQSEATYLFDLASAVGLSREDRTVMAWTLTPDQVGVRDVSYQRGFPLEATGDGAGTDRGHLIAHQSGGLFGPNIFRQDRALNRGWSQAGKRYRALEREAAAVPGTLYFGHLLYNDDSAYPCQIEAGILRGDVLHVERFDNRP